MRRGESVGSGGVERGCAMDGGGKVAGVWGLAKRDLGGRGAQFDESSPAIGANRCHRVRLSLHRGILAPSFFVGHGRAQVKAERVALGWRPPSFGHVRGVEEYRVTPIIGLDEAKSSIDVVGKNGPVLAFCALEKVQRLPKGIPLPGPRWPRPCLSTGSFTTAQRRCGDKDLRAKCFARVL
jgi:hypothetical protein